MSFPPFDPILSFLPLLYHLNRFDRYVIDRPLWNVAKCSDQCFWQENKIDRWIDWFLSLRNWVGLGESVWHLLARVYKENDRIAVMSHPISPLLYLFCIKEWYAWTCRSNLVVFKWMRLSLLLKFPLLFFFVRDHYRINKCKSKNKKGGETFEFFPSRSFFNSSLPSPPRPVNATIFLLVRRSLPPTPLSQNRPLTPSAVAEVTEKYNVRMYVYVRTKNLPQPPCLCFRWLRYLGTPRSNA